MSENRKEISNLEELLGRIRETTAGEGDVSLDDILGILGSRSFGTMLLLAGIITLAPLVGDIPGVPTIIALFVGLTSVQLLLRRDHVWLPEWMLKRSISSDKLEKALGWMQRPAEIVDRLLRERLVFLTQGVMKYVSATLCLCVAAVMPALEFIPFSANAAGATLTLFGLSFIARDGLMALIAILFSTLAFGFALFHLL